MKTSVYRYRKKYSNLQLGKYGFVNHKLINLNKISGGKCIDHLAFFYNRWVEYFNIEIGNLR